MYPSPEQILLILTPNMTDCQDHAFYHNMKQYSKHLDSHNKDSAAIYLPHTKQWQRIYYEEDIDVDKLSSTIR